MTRGQIIGVFEDKILKSIEFNGDMMPESRGMFLLDMIECCDTEHNFIYAVKKFDLRFFGYGRESGEPILKFFVRTELDLRDYTHGYCDYLYLSNHSGEEITVIDRAGKSRAIPNGDTAIYHYYEYLMSAKEAKQREDQKIAEIYDDE